MVQQTRAKADEILPAPTTFPIEKRRGEDAFVSSPSSPLSGIVPVKKKSVQTTDPRVLEQIKVLRDSSSKEGDMVMALWSLSQFFNEGASIAKQDVTDLLLAIKQNVIFNPAVANNMKYYHSYNATSSLFQHSYFSDNASNEHIKIALECLEPAANLGPSSIFSAFSVCNSMFSNSYITVIQPEDSLKAAGIMLSCFNTSQEFGAINALAMILAQSEKVNSFPDFDISYMARVAVAVLQDSNINESVRASAGCLLIQCGLHRPELFEHEDFKFLHLDKQLLDNMASQSPGWFGDDAMRCRLADFRQMALLAIRNPGEPIIKTIFEDTNTTYFGAWDYQILEHQYANRNKATGKPLWFVASTKFYDGAVFPQHIQGKFLDKFDIRICEPGEDNKILSILSGISGRIGIKPKSQDPNGAKFKFLAVLGHGDPAAIRLKREPNYLDITDGALLQQISEYFKEAVGYLMACSTAGGTGAFLNFAETVAQNIGMKLFGASYLASLNSSNEVSPIIIGLDKNGEWTFLDVYLGSTRNSYDKRKTEPLETPDFHVEKSEDGSVTISWQSQNKETTENYDVQRSIDGKLFERVALVPKHEADGFAAYSLSDKNPPAGETVFYRVEQRNFTWTQGNVPGSKDYTFATSEAKPVAIPSSINNEETIARDSLGQNYPNPASSETAIQLKVGANSHVEISLFDMSGKKIATLLDEQGFTGNKPFLFNVQDYSLQPGIYIYTLEVNGKKVDSKRMIVD